MQVSPAAEQAARFTEFVAAANPVPGSALDVVTVSIARKIAAGLRREREGTSRSGVPLTRLSR